MSAPPYVNPATQPGTSPLYALTPDQVNRAQSAQWRQAMKLLAVDLCVATPAFLTEDIDPVTQTVTVQVAIQERVRTKTGPQWWDVFPIIKVPVILPRGGGWAWTLPLKKGDEGLLVFCDTCFDFWWVNGQNNAPKAANVTAASGSQVQNEVRRHHVHDCGFLPGMTSQPNVLPNYSTTSAQLRSVDGTVVIDLATAGVTVTAPTIQLTAPSVHANANAGTPLALVNDTWFQWWVANIYPFLTGLGYLGPAVPVASETTVLKGE